MDLKRMELVCLFYEHFTQNKKAYKKKTEEWWLLDACDVVKTTDAPTAQKVSEKRCLYFFDFLSYNIHSIMEEFQDFLWLHLVVVFDNKGQRYKLFF